MLVSYESVQRRVENRIDELARIGDYQLVFIRRQPSSEEMRSIFELVHGRKMSKDELKIEQTSLLG